jgi:hypothetical protein
VVGKDVIKSLYYYSGWNLPKDAFLIDIYIHSRGASVDGPFKTFAGPATWDEITYVLPPGKAGFNYSLSKEDKDAIRSVSQDLWEKAKGDNLGRVIKLIDAGPILLKPR